MNYRDYLQQLIYKIINPLIHGMIKIGIDKHTCRYRIYSECGSGRYVCLCRYLWRTE